jgi:hypothetical protein
MFPKQKCWACQNRAWEGTTSGIATLQNKTMKNHIIALEEYILTLETKLKIPDDLRRKPSKW